MPILVVVAIRRLPHEINAALKKCEEFFATLDLHSSNSSKLFRIIQKYNGLTPEPTCILHYQGTDFTDKHVLKGWEKYFAALSANADLEYDER